MTVGKEERFTIVVAQYFEAMMKPDVWWSHVPSGGKRSKVTAALLQRMGTKRGFPDFIILNPGGHHHAIELKLDNSEIFQTKRTYQSPDQKAFQQAWEATGGIYRVCRSLEEVVAYCELYGLCRRDRSVVAA